MAFQLPKLDYAYNALEPHIDAMTMEIHHSKHHQTYINNLNAALEKLGGKFATMSLEDLLARVTTVRMNAQQASARPKRSRERGEYLFRLEFHRSPESIRLRRDHQVVVRARTAPARDDRIKQKLKGLSPVQYRTKSLLLS